MTKKETDRIFDKLLGSPMGQINGLVQQARELIVKKEKYERKQN